MAHFTRSQWRARARRHAPGTMLVSEVKGIALHWPATKTRLNTVAEVMAALRGWQNYHMDDQGWSDIGYQLAVDQMGNTYDLRGILNRSAANGGTVVNRQYGAVLLVLAAGEKASSRMIAETQEVVAEHRLLFPRSRIITGHGAIRPRGPTECPGPEVRRLIASGAFEPGRKEWSGMSKEEITAAVVDAFSEGLPLSEHIRKDMGYGRTTQSIWGGVQYGAASRGVSMRNEKKLVLLEAKIDALLQAASGGSITLSADEVATKMASLMLPDLVEALVEVLDETVDCDAEAVAGAVMDLMSVRLAGEEEV